MNFKRSTLALFASLVFLCGGVLGALAHRLYTVSSVAAIANPRNPEDMRRRFMSDRQSRLKLNDDQVTKFSAIMEETRARFGQVRATLDPEMKKIREEEEQQIRALLSPEQQTQWETLRKERMMNRGKRGGPGRPGGFMPPPFRP